MLVSGAGHELGLVVERALAKGQPDGDELLLVAPQPQVPAGRTGHRVTAGLAVDGHQRLALGQLPRPQSSMTAQTASRSSGSRMPAQSIGHVHSTRRPAVRSA